MLVTANGVLLKSALRIGEIRIFQCCSMFQNRLLSYVCFQAAVEKLFDRWPCSLNCDSSVPIYFVLVFNLLAKTNDCTYVRFYLRFTILRSRIKRLDFSGFRVTFIISRTFSNAFILQMAVSTEFVFSRGFFIFLWLFALSQAF